MQQDFSDLELFWDEITRERISEVDSDSPFDFLVRGDYDTQSNTVRRVNLENQNTSVEVDMVNVDLDSCYIRVYEVDFSPVAESIPSRFPVSVNEGLATLFQDLENSWSYETSLIVFDSEEEYYVPEEGVLEGSVYWPGRSDYEPESAYRDITDVLGADVLSDL